MKGDSMKAIIGRTIIKQGTTKIEPEEFAFEGIKGIIIPDTVTVIGEDAFTCCDNLTQVEIPNSVIDIRKTAFYMCENLQIVTIPNSVKHIGRAAFGQCKKLTIRCYKGSYAAEYAIKHKITVEYID